MRWSLVTTARRLGIGLPDRRDPGLREGPGRLHRAERPGDAVVLHLGAVIGQFELGEQPVEVDRLRGEAEAPEGFDQALDGRAETLARHAVTFGSGV